MAKDFAKSKCFIKTDNGYEEITYEELLRREEADPSYKGRRFLPLHGMLMEVTPEQYRDFYKARRRQKYLYERSRENRDISIDMLTTEQFNGADILVSDGMDIEEQVAYKLLLDKLHSCLALLTEEERELIYALFFGEKTEREWSAETGIPQKTINDRKRRILSKLKKTSGNLKNIFAQAPHFSAWKVRGFFMASRNLENRIPIRQVRSHCFCDKHKPR